MSGLSPVKGSCSGFSYQPIELIVSQTPTNQGLQTRVANVLLKSAARLKVALLLGASIPTPAVDCVYPHQQADGIGYERIITARNEVRTYAGAMPPRAPYTRRG